MMFLSSEICFQRPIDLSLYRANRLAASIAIVFTFLNVVSSLGEEKSGRISAGDPRRATQQLQPRELQGRDLRINSVPVPRAIPVDGKTGGSSAAVGSSAASPGEPKAGDSAGASNASLPNTMEGLNDKRQLRIGDKVSFSVKEDEKQPYSLVVTDSGELEVPYVGRVAVGNRTCKQLAYSIKSMLEKEFYYQATVLIGLDSEGRGAVSRGVCYLIGQVRNPGPQAIPADEVLTVSKAIMRAGGFTQYSNKRKVKLMRAGQTRGEKGTIEVDMVEVLEKGHRERDPEIGPEDIITVPEKFWNFLSE